MWANLISLVTKAWTLVKSNGLEVVLQAACWAFIGFALAANHYHDVMNEKELAARRAVIEMQRRVADERLEQERRIAQAVAERDEALASADAGRESVERLRRKLLATTAATGTGTDSCKRDREAVADCRRLLAEGVGLLDEGRRLLVRNAANHDALSKSLGHAR